MKLLLASVVAALAISAAPASARTYSDVVRCVKVADGKCTKWDRLTDKQALKAQWKTGYVFGPSYTYSDFKTIPANFVTEYSLDPNARYVYQNGYIYIVDPTTYAVSKVIYTTNP